MFIDTGGLPEQHRPHSGGKLHLQHQCHNHGHRHLQQFGQLHLPYRSRRLTAARLLLFPDPRHHGSHSPAPLLLKPGPHSPPHLCLSNPSSPPFLLSHPVQPHFSPLSLHRDHKTNMEGLHKLHCPS